MSMLTELRSLAATVEAERDEAEREFGAARARTMGLEKLEARHAAAAAASALAAEQVVLDELGSAARLRGAHEPGSGGPGA
jgi:flagellar FliJ protein